MADASALTLSFLEKRPSSAAQTLASMDASDAAAFLEMVPSRYIVATLGHMSEWSASSVIKEMAPASAAAALREMDYPSATAILRLLDEDQQPKLLELLPEKLRRDLETSLSFPSDTVGAKMTTAIVTLTGEQTAAEAIGLLQKSVQAKADAVFVLDYDRKLRGVVSAAVLLKSRPAVELHNLMDASVNPLSARARLSAIAALPEWDDYAQLPVLSRKKLVIGALSRKTARADNRVDGAHILDPSTSITTSIASAFFTSAIGLSQLIADSGQPAVKSNQKGVRS